MRERGWNDVREEKKEEETLLLLLLLVVMVVELVKSLQPIA